MEGELLCLFLRWPYGQSMISSQYDKNTYISQSTTNILTNAIGIFFKKPIQVLHKPLVVNPPPPIGHKQYKQITFNPPPPLTCLRNTCTVPYI